MSSMKVGLKVAKPVVEKIALQPIDKKLFAYEDTQPVTLIDCFTAKIGIWAQVNKL